MINVLRRIILNFFHIIQYHQQWMNPTDKINSISPDNMKRAKFLERANEIAIEYSDEKTWKQIFEALKD